MPFSVPKSLEQSIFEKLTNLTFQGKLIWLLENQTYSTVHNGIRYAIVDSGQNWLEIDNINHKESYETITDYTAYVGELLNEIKNQLKQEKEKDAKRAKQNRENHFEDALKTLE